MRIAPVTSILSVIFFGVTAAATAQGGPPDEDRSLWPRQPSFQPTLRPPGQRPQLVVSSPTTWENGSFRIDDAGAECDLVLAPGGTLTLRNARLEVIGNVILQDASLLRVEDADLELYSLRGSNDFEYLWQGGQLSTLRATIGGRRDKSYYSSFRLNNGLWTAEATTVHDSGGIHIGRSGSSLPEEKGGTLIANGLFAGEIADRLHMNASGDAFLRNSSFGVELRLFDAGSSSVPVMLDLETEQLIASRAYGDMTLRSGITHHIPGAPWRLKLENCTVTNWSLDMFELGGPNQRIYELRNADNITIGLHGHSFSGSPTRTGPWRTFYPQGPLPELPATREPGHHAMPPGCGVKIGPLEIRSAAGSWNRIAGWSIYLERPTGGVTTVNDFTVRGPTSLSEIQVGNGTLHLLGTEAFDLGVRALEVEAYDMGTIDMSNALLGTSPGRAPTIVASGTGVVNLDQVKLRDITLRTRAQSFGGSGRGVDAGTITMTNHFASSHPQELLGFRTSPGGTINAVTEPPTGNADLQNLDFEQGIQGGVPDYWAGTGVSGQLVASGVPGGGQAFRYAAVAAAGRIHKRLVLPPGTRVELYGRLGPAALGAGVVECAIEGVGSGGRSVAQPVPSPTLWRGFFVAGYTVQPQDTAVDLVFGHTGSASVQVDVDQLSVRLATFWEYDNFQNLGFEEPRQRRFGVYPFRWQAPDFWRLIEGQASIETADLAPGTTGTQSVKVVTTYRKAVLSKELHMLGVGDTITVSGQVKAVHAPGNGRYTLRINVGAGNTFFRPTTCNNQEAIARSADAAAAVWQPFTLTYTVPDPSCLPANTSPETRIGIAGGEPNDWFLLDDLQVVFQ